MVEGGNEHPVEDVPSASVQATHNRTDQHAKPRPAVPQAQLTRFSSLSTSAKTVVAQVGRKWSSYIHGTLQLMRIEVGSPG